MAIPPAISVIIKQIYRTVNDKVSIKDGKLHILAKLHQFRVG